MPWLRLMVVMATLSGAALAQPAPAPAAAGTDSVQRAKEAFLAGQALYKEGRYREAAARFEEANFLSPRAGNWFNLARCYEQVGETAKALAAFRSYLREAPSAPERTEVEGTIARLQGLLRQSGVQQLQVLVEPKDARATVSIDGRMVGVSPLTIELSKGTHSIAVEAAGFAPQEKKVDVKLEAASDVVLELVRAAPKDAPLQVGVNPPLVDAPPPPPLVTDTAAPRKPYVFAWVATGLTVVAVGVATALYFLAAGVQTDLRNPPGGTPRTLADNQALYQKGSGLQLGSFITYGAAGALGITTALLFALEGK